MRRSLLVIAAGVATYGAVVGGATAWASRAREQARCPPTGTLIFVDTNQHLLSLCRKGIVEGGYRVGVGRGGLDKRTEGDDRTPTGTYSLGLPRLSTSYHVFIPVSYPTMEQRSLGYSGSAIGIHGPHRAFRWLGHATASVDWTRGCVAVGTRAEIDEVAKWVRDTGAQQVVIQ